MRRPIAAMYLVALIALLAGGWSALHSALFLMRAEAVDAEVVRVDVVTGDDRRVTHRPIVRWLDKTREPHEWTGPGQYDSSSYGPGDHLRLLRDPATGELRTGGFADLWTGSIVGLVLVWTFGGVGWLMGTVERGADSGMLVGAMLYFGLPLLLGAIGAAVSDAFDYFGGVRTTGLVVNGKGVPWKLSKEGEARGNIPGRVRITADDGRVVEFVDGRYNAIFARPNEPVTVVHPAGRPYAGRVVDGVEFWLSPLLLAAFGVPLVSVAAVVWWRGRGRPRRWVQPGL